MAETTGISWCDSTFNPWMGCTRVHAGCTHCYAESFAKRYGKAQWGPSGTRVKTSVSYWKQPIKWNRDIQDNAVGMAVEVYRDETRWPEFVERRRVFCASLADVFEDWTGPILNSDGERLARDTVKGGYIPTTLHVGQDIVSMANLRRDLFELIDSTPNLDWLLLTKRPENVRKMWPDTKAPPQKLVDAVAEGRSGTRYALHRPNVWLLTSVSDQATADAMIPELLKCRGLCPVLGVSAEPLLGPLDLSRIRHGADHDLPIALGKPWGIDWVIVGGESGQGARPCDLEWIRSIRDQCKAADVACFIKQLGGRPTDVEAMNTIPAARKVYTAEEAKNPTREMLQALESCFNAATVRLADPKGGDPAEWPADLRVREFPKVEE